MSHHDLQVGPLLRRIYWFTGGAIVTLSLTAALTFEADRRADLDVLASFNRERLARDVQTLTLERQDRLRSFAVSRDPNAKFGDVQDGRTLLAKLDTLAVLELPATAEDTVVRGIRTDLAIWDSTFVSGAYATGSADSAQLASDASPIRRVRDRFVDLRHEEDASLAEAEKGDAWLRVVWVGSVVVELLLLLVGLFFAHRLILNDVGAVMESQHEVLDRLAAAGEYRDDDTGQHTRRVGELAGRIAEAMGVGTARMATIRRAAALHDVGKIGMPDSILLKSGKLTAEEMDVIRQHTVIGARILDGGHSLVVATAARIARSHHERWNGTGYPDQLAGDQIPLEARITAVADVFDSIRSKRPYRDAFALEVSLEEIRRGAGSQFDPTVVQAFFDARCYEGYAVEGGESQDAEAEPLIRQLTKKAATPSGAGDRQSHAPMPGLKVIA
jgi:putative nucleotidyltransferase with HDIG domain